MPEAFVDPVEIIQIEDHQHMVFLTRAGRVAPVGEKPPYPLLAGFLIEQSGQRVALHAPLHHQFVFLLLVDILEPADDTQDIAVVGLHRAVGASEPLAGGESHRTDFKIHFSVLTVNDGVGNRLVQPAVIVPAHDIQSILSLEEILHCHLVGTVVISVHREIFLHSRLVARKNADVLFGVIVEYRLLRVLLDDIVTLILYQQLPAQPLALGDIAEHQGDQRTLVFTVHKSRVDIIDAYLTVHMQHAGFKHRLALFPVQRGQRLPEKLQIVGVNDAVPQTFIEKVLEFQPVPADHPVEIIVGVSDGDLSLGIDEYHCHADREGFQHAVGTVSVLGFAADFVIEPYN